MNITHAFSDIVRNLRTMRWEYRLLIAITLLGAFFRAYGFHDWLRFNPDQARDALVVFDMTTGEIPLLGPPAGGTEFRLGPITHYFSFLSGSLFGFHPDVLAYPDLLFSILTVPLIFLLVSRMFGKRIGLAAAMLAAISGFMIRYGRFQWNPNTMPFFTILFLLSGQIFFEKNARNRYMWALIFGIAIGVGVQLHTFLLVLFPILTVFLFGYLAVRKSLSWSMVGVAIGVSLVLNIPQVISETKTHFSNTAEFLEGMHSQTESSRSILSRMGRDAVCHVQVNTFILTGLGASDDCKSFVSVAKKSSWRQPLDVLFIAFELLFSVGGIFLLGYFARRETDVRRKNTLVSIIAYEIGLFLIIIPVADEVAVRYFLASAFTPFVLFGAWAAIFVDRGLLWKVALGGFFIVVLFTNGRFLLKEYVDFQSGRVSDGEISILGEVEPLALFLSQHMNPGEPAYLIGMRNYRQRFHRALSYLLRTQEKTLLRWEDDSFPSDPGPVFLIRKKTGKFDAATEIEGHRIIDRVTSGKVSIFLLRER